MKYKDSLELIGKTPIVKLEKLSKKYQVNFYIKLESFNLTGSVKDRSALKMINDAEADGKLSHRTTIIESSSGNLGISLAAICSIKGYKFICVTDAKTSQAKINAIKAYGGKIIKINKKSSNGSYLENRIIKVKKILKQIPYSVNLDQYNNTSNSDAHYTSTGPEIYKDLDGKIDAVVGCVSTSGTMMGIAKYLKQKLPQILTAGVEPVGSVIFGGKYKSYLQQGPGISFIPKIYNEKLIDIKVKVNDKNAFYTARMIAKTEGLLLGGSSGAAIYAAINLKKMNKKLKEIVIIAPDNGDRYFDTIYSDKWLKSKSI